MLFFLDIDFTKDKDLAKTEDDPYPRAIETKFNNLVFRARHTSPADDAGLYYPPFEYFEMTFDLG